MQIMQWYNPKTRAENTGYLYTYATGCIRVSENNYSRILGE